MSAEWKDALAAVDEAIGTLNGTTFDEEQALSAVLAITRMENRLWQTRRTVEAAWLDLAGDVSRMVDLIAVSEGVAPAVVVEDLHRKRIITVDWYRAKKELRERGIDPVPTTERTDQ